MLVAADAYCHLIFVHGNGSGIDFESHILGTACT